jgi:hypothetical protein
MTHMMLAARYKELDEELAQARQRVAELLGAWEDVHSRHLAIKGYNQVNFAKQYNLAEGSIEARKQAARGVCAESAR